MSRNYDVIVVGGGTAGCVLSARLSEEPTRRVLLIEAGPDMLPGQEPAAIRDPYPSGYGDPKYAWAGLTAEVGADLGDGRPRASRGFVQGRGMGGSSSIMGMMASRGGPADYDAWRDLGARGWGWDDVLPYFRKLEHDLDFTGPLHGADGPIPIRRQRREDWAPFCRAVAEAMEARGFPYLPDYNGQFEDGVSTIPMNNLPDRRVSTAMGYLDQVARRRPNLHILTDAVVETVTFEGRQATGVRVRVRGEVQSYRAAETILAAGAIHSPALLQRSGIGAAQALLDLGIAPVADLPGVGENLLNHVIVQLAVYLPRHAKQDAALRAWAFSILQFSSAQTGSTPGDMHIFPNNRASWHPLGQRIGALGMGVRRPFSHGDVRILSADPAVKPQVRFNILSDPRDFERLVEGVRLGCALLADPRVVANRDEVFVPAGGQANSLNRPSFANWAKSLAILVLFDLSPSLRRRLLGRSFVDPARLLEDDAALRALVRGAAAPVHHPCGTAKIGAVGDRMAVVDPECRVIGVRGLRVADASIMPMIVSANTHLPVVMIGEKAADMIARAFGRQAA